MTTMWAGIDSGKRAHHCVVLDHAGAVALSRRVDNDEGDLLELIATVTELAADGDKTPPDAPTTSAKSPRGNRKRKQSDV